MPGPTANTAYCNNAVGDRTNVGSYTGSASPNGTFDQGGNVWEWSEQIEAPSGRGARGGSRTEDASTLASSYPNPIAVPPSFERGDLGFRVAMIPEPIARLLVMTGLLGLAYRQRRRGRAAQRGRSSPQGVPG